MRNVPAFCEYAFQVGALRDVSVITATLFLASCDRQPSHPGKLSKGSSREIHQRILIALFYLSTAAASKHPWSMRGIIDKAIHKAVG